MKRQGLGRNLDALLSRRDIQAASTIADSIRAQGVIQPIVVRSSGQGRYEIIAGE